MLSVSILTKVVYTCKFSMVRDFSFVYYMLELSIYMRFAILLWIVFSFTLPQSSCAPSCDYFDCHAMVSKIEIGVQHCSKSGQIGDLCSLPTVKEGQTFVLKMFTLYFVYNSPIYTQFLLYQATRCSLQLRLHQLGSNFDNFKCSYTAVLHSIPFFLFGGQCFM